MYDRDLVLEILTQIHDATLTVIKRFTPIKSVDDLTGSFEGREKLDALCMQLIAAMKRAYVKEKILLIST